MDDDRVSKARAEWKKEQKQADMERRLFDLAAEFAASPFKRLVLVVLVSVLLALWLLPR
ncbi:hypothetical protein ACFQ4M_19715 [Thauera mechernichensis]|uniref:Uncharacterized protein n=1 Tax=Thauera mechernichensis TaxID=82788 RepID=A0ABW3WKH7_9RHOO|nr:MULTISPECIES: hypothetical protein [Betaproteobacteria]MDG3066873.1 hypothetical protein [Thauera mechernichensis]